MHISDWSSELCSSELTSQFTYRILLRFSRGPGIPLFDQALRTGSVYMINIEINGEARALDVAEDTPLLWVLRDELGLTGTKFGCGMALCGACTVHVDGVATRACVTAVGDVAGSRSEEHTSDLQSLKSNSYPVFCFQNNTKDTHQCACANI